ncbi:MAG TPA: hypothetical protein VN862_04370 [Candidatus Acidoferrales bacterium]|nr:hypothetical protein [Candidatus Acidoferrales bacterium]
MREHASEREKLSITADYYLDVTGELDKAAQAFQTKIESYPRDARSFSDLAQIYAERGQYDKADEIGRQDMRLAPDEVSSYENLASTNLALQRFDEVRKILNEAPAERVDHYLYHSLYELGFVGGDAAAMSEEQKWFAGKPEHENVGLALAADTEAYAGHLGKARELTKRAVESAIRSDSKENGAVWQANAALEDAGYGDPKKGREEAAAAVKLAPMSAGTEAEAALAFAMAGDTTRAESLAQDLKKRFPLDTQMQLVWLTAIRAQIALDAKNPNAAVDGLQDALPVEMGSFPFVNNISCLYSPYVRGEAYLASGQGAAAVTEFRKILDHSGMVENCWTGALARLGEARANGLDATRLRGADADAARVRALAAYSDCLKLWHDADPDIPALKQAKAEYAKLQ